MEKTVSSWGLSLFVLFEREQKNTQTETRSWGLSLFVLFERSCKAKVHRNGSWGLSLFVLFERHVLIHSRKTVLED